MANKAAKTLAQKNTATLNRTHLISLGVYLFFIMWRALLAQRRLLPFILLSTPALAIEFWFERIGRPSYTTTSTGSELKRSGEDLEAKGLTEWMWDVVYWTWGNVVGVRQGFGGLNAGAGRQGGAGEGSAGQSKRAAKMEKRVGQRVQYR